MSPKIERPKAVSGTTHCVETGCGKLFATINHLDGKPFETFLKLGSQGSCTSAFMAALATLLSVALRSGVPLGAFMKVLSAATCPAARREVVDIVPTEDGYEDVVVETPSCMAALGRLLGEVTEPVYDIPSSTGPFAGSLEDVPTGCGNVAISCFGHDGALSRVTVEIGAAGSCAAAIGSTLAKCINIALAYGIDREDIGKSLLGIHCPKSNHACLSCIDATGQKIAPLAAAARTAHQ